MVAKTAPKLTKQAGRDEIKAYAQDTRAETPVIALILMVTITVILATTVFVLVSTIEVTATPPAITFSKEDNNLTVLSTTPPGLKWGEFTVENCTHPPATKTIDAGDVLTNCSGMVTIVHTRTNSMIYWTRF